MPKGTGIDLVRTFAQNVRTERLQLGLTIDEVAECASLDVLTLVAIERGESHQFTMFRLEKLAGALGVRADVLLEEIS